MLNRICLVLLLVTPATLAGKYLHFSPLLLFFLAALAIIPLAKFMGDGESNWLEGVQLLMA